MKWRLQLNCSFMVEEGSKIGLYPYKTMKFLTESCLFPFSSVRVSWILGTGFELVPCHVRANGVHSGGHWSDILHGHLNFVGYFEQKMWKKNRNDAFSSWHILHNYGSLGDRGSACPSHPGALGSNLAHGTPDFSYIDFSIAVPETRKEKQCLPSKRY